MTSVDSLTYQAGVMMDRGSGSGWYLAARGEILRFAKDSQKRKRSTTIPPLIKNES